ncbi:MAG: deoxyribonuclease IV [Deltaproteobacteria bacterium]|nr:MAG: deoxyribonuclease IV [Deltaproteobacteria bacterium]
MSISGGLPRALERGRTLGCNTVQFFLKNARSWRSRVLDDGERGEFLMLKDRLGLEPLIAHCSYLINIASPNPSLYERSIEALREELLRTQALGIPYYVLHPGSPTGTGEQEGLYRIARALNLLLQDLQGVMVLLETTARGIGSRFENFARILEMLEEEQKVGICIDTCHLWVAGYDIADPRGYEETLKELDDLIGLEKLKVVHLNDSKAPRGSGRDRHEHIGFGKLGPEPFRWLLQDERLKELPFIIETPKGVTPEGEDWDEVNLRILRSLEGEDEDKGDSGGYRP